MKIQPGELFRIGSRYIYLAVDDRSSRLAGVSEVTSMIILPRRRYGEILSFFNCRLRRVYACGYQCLSGVYDYELE